MILSHLTLVFFNQKNRQEEEAIANRIEQTINRFFCAQLHKHFLFSSQVALPFSMYRISPIHGNLLHVSTSISNKQYSSELIEHVSIGILIIDQSRTILLYFSFVTIVCLLTIVRHVWKRREENRFAFIKIIRCTNMKECE